LRSVLTGALLVLASACAHAGRAPLGEVGRETVHVGEAVFHLHYQPEDLAAAQQVKRALPLAVPAATRWGTLTTPVHLTIHPTHEALEAAAQLPGRGWVRGWARYASVDLQSPRTWSAGRASDEQMARILAHEVAHCAMYQAIATASTWRAAPVPLWFKEGMATAAAGEDHGPPSQDVVRRLGGPARGSALESDADQRAAYGGAEVAFRFLVERHGDGGVRAVMARMSEGRAFAEAFLAALGISVQEFERDLGRSVAADASPASSRRG
jgi:hypothetical protein